MEAYNARESLEIFEDEDQDWSVKEYLNLTVSPKLANHLLNNHYRQNRKVKKKVVEKYARDMKSGQWLFTGESIGIDIEGKILDGQHRLMAIRQADINMELPFAFGLPVKAMRAMDSGSSRSYSDYLTITQSKKLSNALATAIRYMTIWDLGPKDFSSNLKRAMGFSPAELDDCFARHRDIEKFVSDPIFDKGWVKKNRSIFGFVYYLLHRNCPEESKAFFEGLATGANLSSSSPILLLRERLTAVKNGRLEPIRTDLKFYLLSKAWNNFLEGKEIRNLVIPRVGLRKNLKIEFLVK
jgi:hypothetical protein